MQLPLLFETMTRAFHGYTRGMSYVKHHSLTIIYLHPYLCHFGIDIFFKVNVLSCVRCFSHLYTKKEGLGSSLTRTQVMLAQKSNEKSKLSELQMNGTILKWQSTHVKYDCPSYPTSIT